MEPVDWFAFLFFDVGSWVLAALAVVLSVRGLLLTTSYGWAKTVTALELAFLGALILFLGTGVKLIKLAVIDEFYYAEQVQRYNRASGKREKIDYIEFKIENAQDQEAPSWYRPITYWLNDEGKRDLGLGIISDYVIVALKWKAKYNTKAFTLEVQVPKMGPDSNLYDLITNMAYIESKEQDIVNVRMVAVTPGDDFNNISIDMPEIIQDEQIVIISRITAKSGRLPDDLESILTSKVN